MDLKRNLDFLQAALGLHLITERQFIELQDLCRTGSHDYDISEVMVNRELISEDQAKSIFNILDQAVSFAGSTAARMMNTDNSTKAGRQDKLLFAPISYIDGRDEHSASQTKHDDHNDINYAHYTIVGTIGVGGLGRVLHGMDRSLQREVAIKEIIDDKLTKTDKRLLARFLNEARITGQLQHPGIVPVYQIGAKANGSLFYVMKYVRGHSLEDAINKANENADPSEAMKERLALLGVLIDVCDAMGYAHDKGVIHRDLKPANVILGSHGENVILDWGLAKYYSPKERDESTEEIVSADLDKTTIVRNSSESLNLTVDGEILGTPAYMAPEQVEPDFGAVDQTTDVYALGVILFQIITGKLPYKAPSAKILLRQLTSDDPSPDPRSITPNCPPELATICLKAMAKKKAERFTDATQLADQLKAYRDGRMVSVYCYTRKELFQRFIKQHKALIAGILIAMVAVIIGSIFSVYYGMNAVQNAKIVREVVEQLPELENRSLHKVLEFSAQFDKYFSDVNNEIVPVAQTIYDNNLTTSETINPHLKTLFEKRDISEGYYYIDKTGTVLGAWPQSVFGTIGQSIKDQDHFKVVCASKAPYLSKVFRVIEGYDAVIYDVPVVYNGEVVGLLNCMIRPEVFLAKAFSQNSWAKNIDLYRAFVVEGETCRMLYDISDPQLIGESLLTCKQTDNQESFKTFLRMILKEEIGIGKFTMEYNINQKKEPIIHRVAAWKTFSCGPTEWKIVVASLFQEGVGVIGANGKKVKLKNSK